VNTCRAGAPGEAPLITNLRQPLRYWEAVKWHWVLSAAPLSHGARINGLMYLAAGPARHPSLAPEAKFW
jgi:hypothetical protein